jgi:hypothetical protein
MQQHNQGTPRYDGPRELAQSLTALAHMDASQATWNREDCAKTPSTATSGSPPRPTVASASSTFAP